MSHCLLSSLLAFKSRQARNDFNLLRSYYLQSALCNLTGQQCPNVLNQMASNLSWTSALGDAYFNIPQDVMNSIQVMRQRASQAGNLKSNPQQKVTTEADAPPRQQMSSDQQPAVVQAP